MRAIPPLVSTHWLAKNIDGSQSAIIDIRRSEEYAAGHIPNSIGVPFPSWVTTRNDLLLELPEAGDLFNIIGSAGIRGDSTVVVVNKTDTHFTLADTTRVACTLLYAGVMNVAVLNGGHNKWAKERKPMTDKIVKPKTVQYKGKVHEMMFVSKEYVQKRIGKSTIIDVRTPSDFFGATQDPFAERAGHIPSAVCLPAPWIWTHEGTYRSIKELRDMAIGIVGRDRSQEIIIYCGVGGYSSAWCFVLREVLGYTDVRIYDGSAEEWTRDPEAPVVKYRWN